MQRTMHHTVVRIPFTREAYEKMQVEQATLQKELGEVKIRLQAAREMGDLSENGAYHYAKFELGRIYRELKRLGNLLKVGQIIERSSASENIQFGSTVTLKRDDEETQYIMVSLHESDPKEHKLSIESPLGKALLGKYVNDEVDVETPGGTKHYLITKIA